MEEFTQYFDDDDTKNTINEKEVDDGSSKCGTYELCEGKVKRCHDSD